MQNTNTKKTSAKVKKSGNNLKPILDYLPTGINQQQYLEKFDAELPELDIPDRTYGDLKKKDYVELYRLLYMIRGMESRLTRLYRLGKIVGGVYLSKGMEAISVGAGYALDRSKGDILFPMHRDLGAHLAFGQNVYKLYSQYMANADSPTAGRDGNAHCADYGKGIVGMISHLGAMIPVAVGAAIGLRMKGKKAVTMTFIGDGGASIGDFHEGLNFAAVANAPFVLIVENNQYAYSTPTVAQFGGARIIDRAPGYGIPGELVDGNNMFEVYEVVKKAIDRARKGHGPTMIEAVTMRMRGHSEHDDHFYVPKELLEKWAERDPVLRAKKFTLKKRFITAKALAKMEVEVDEELETAIEKASNFGPPSPDGLVKALFSD